jgi:hypothetical protein
MSVKVVTNKTYLENINGLKNFEKYNIDYDSNRDINKQVKAVFNTNGKQYYIEDSLQKFMHSIPSNKRSIFDLLKNDLRESKKYNSTDNYGPNKVIKLKKGETRKSNKEKYRVSRGITSRGITSRGIISRGITSRGITSKLFDYDKETMTPEYNHIIDKHEHKDEYSKKHRHNKKNGRHSKKHRRRNKKHEHRLKLNYKLNT